VAERARLIDGERRIREHRVLAPVDQRACNRRTASLFSVRQHATDARWRVVDKDVISEAHVVRTPSCAGGIGPQLRSRSRVDEVCGPRCSITIRRPAVLKIAYSDYRTTQRGRGGIRMKKVFVARNPAEAHLVKGMLEAAGLKAEVRGEALWGTRGETPLDAETSPTVWVLDDKHVPEA